MAKSHSICTERIQIDCAQKLTCGRICLMVAVYQADGNFSTSTTSPTAWTLAGLRGVPRVGRVAREDMLTPAADLFT